MKLALHWKIIIGLVLGVIVGLLGVAFGWSELVVDFVMPFGKIFINLLKLIAVPLVLFSLISGVSSLSNIAKLSRIGTKTIILYLSTTVIAVSIGLFTVNLAKPWNAMDDSTKQSLIDRYSKEAKEKNEAAETVESQGPLQFLVDLVPDNILSAATDNRNMLQVIFFAILFGIAMIMVDPEKISTVKSFFEGANEVVLRMVDIIMLLAPMGTFALMAGLIVDVATETLKDGTTVTHVDNALDLLIGLGGYGATVVLALFLLGFVMYPLILRLFTKYDIRKFFKAIAPAQLLAFSTSSSAATLPVTMEKVQEEVGVSEEVASFVLPLGATINMDGTSCYQAVAAVFIANVMGLDLTFMDQLSIVLTATLASIGSAAVPGAGMVMLAVVLGQLQVPTEGIALIIGIDRILDMCRTVINVTGDATVATVVAKMEGQLTRN